MTRKTKADKIIDWTKNNKVLSIVIVIGVVIIAVGTFAGALEKIKNLLSPSKLPTPVVKIQFADQEPKKCAFDDLAQKPFKHKNSTKILIAVFEGGRAEAKEFGIDISMSIADRLDEYSKDSLHLGTEDIEVYRLDCFVQNHSDAREILDTLGADVFVWGNNFCVPGSEKAKFCPKATLTRRISTLEARGERVEVKEQFTITDLDLPSLTAETPYQLLRFILGLHFYLRGTYEHAGEHFEKAGDEIYGSEKGIENVYCYLGNTYAFLSKSDRAIRYYEKCLRILQEVGDQKSKAVILSNLAHLYAGGDNEKAIEYLKKSLNIFQRTGHKRGESIALVKIAELYYLHCHKYDQAIKYYRRNLELCKEMGNREGEWLSLSNIGMICEDWGNHHKGIEYYWKSLRLSQKTGNRQLEAWSRKDLASAYETLGDYDRAIEHYEGALKIWHVSGFLEFEREMVNAIASIYETLGQHDQAVECRNRSLKITEEIENREQQGGMGKIVYLINYLFRGGSPPNPFESGDVNCDNTVNVQDVMYLINYLLTGGPQPCEEYETTDDNSPDAPGMAPRSRERKGNY